MIEIVKTAWSPDAERGLAVALRDDLAEIRHQVESGAAELFRLPQHGWLVTRLERPAGQPPELVLVAGEGRDMDPVITAFKKIALDNGIGSLRVHSARPGMLRKLARHGFVVDEWVFRAVV